MDRRAHLSSVVFLNLYALIISPMHACYIAKNTRRGTALRVPGGWAECRVGRTTRSGMPCVGRVGRDEVCRTPDGYPAHARHATTGRPTQEGLSTCTQVMKYAIFSRTSAGIFKSLK